MKQYSIKKSVSLKGIGLHTGVNVQLTLHPAAAKHGIKFKRADLENTPIIPADVNKVVSTNRGTVLQAGDATIATVEHLLSALVALGIDNVLVEVDGPEIPIMDGSAAPFVEAIENVGLEELSEEREYFEITESIAYKDEATGAEFLALPSDSFQVTSLIDFKSSMIGQQYAALEQLEDYKTQIAPCRTFVFLHELESLLDQNLIKGGSLNNAIVIADRDMTETQLAVLAKKLNRSELKVQKEGILNTVDLHFTNEAARHKLLDVIGDLALVGKPIKGKIIVTKPGHTANVAFAKILKKKYLEVKKLRGKPTYDPEKTPVYDTMQLAHRLPHRYPFLLVDKILELTDNHVVGLKNVTFNEHFFQGHFPNNPVMPGVLQIEAMAQTGGILALSKVPDPENWDTYFLKIDNAKFKYKVVPGDTILFKLELKAPIRRGIVQMQGIAYVGNRIVSEADLTAQVIKRS